MTGLIRHACLNHSQREAAARCTVCQAFFCRECVSEHEGRMICAPCLAKEGRKPGPQQNSRLQSVGGWLLCLVCLTFLWMLFYCLGRLLSSLPNSFHDNLLQ